MKRFLILLIASLLLTGCFKKDNLTVSVFDYNEEEVLTATIFIPGLNTNNFKKYFNENIKIIGIYPKVNVLYKNKLGNLYYSFSKNTIDENIKGFKKYYKNILEKNNFKNDLILYEYNGISIEKVKIFLSYEELNSILKNCYKCSYEKISL